MFGRKKPKFDVHPNHQEDRYFSWWKAVAEITEQCRIAATHGNDPPANIPWAKNMEGAVNKLFKVGNAIPGDTFEMGFRVNMGDRTTHKVTLIVERFA